MTIENGELPRKDYLGDGTTVSFPYTWRIFSPSDLEVYQGSVLLTLFVHYTVTAAGEPNGGNVVFVAAPPAGTTVTILNQLPATQGTDLREGDAMPAEVLEAQHDRDIRLIQQILEILRRVPTLARLSRFTNITLPDPVLGKILGWRDDLTGLENQDKAPRGPEGPRGLTGPAGAGAAPSVSDGVTTIAVPTAIQFPQASGFTVTEPSAGVANVAHQQSVFTPGMVIPHAGGIAPIGWLICDGAAVSRATYAALFAVIGVAYGAGNGTTTFNLPDTRSRFIVGAGIGAGLTLRGVAATGGEETHLLTTAEMPAHRHGLSQANTTPLAASGGNPVVQVSPPAIGPVLESDLTGGGTAHPVMPPWIGMTWIIKI